MRGSAGCRGKAGGGRSGRSETSKPAVAAGVFLDGLAQMRFAEIGPERGRDDKFGVGDLPEEEVAQAHFATGANEQIGVGQVAGVEVLGDDLFGDFGGVDVALLDLGGDGADAFDDLDACAVAEGEDEGQTGVFFEGGAGFGELFLDEFGQAIDLADDIEADIAAVEFADFVLQKPGEIFHQGVHFVLGAVPILDGERVKGQVFYPQFAASADDGTDGFDAVAVAFDARQVAGLGPTAVAIHDDGNVGGEAGFGLGAELDGNAHRLVQRKMVCSRAGPTEAMVSLAPVWSAMNLR